MKFAHALFGFAVLAAFTASAADYYVATTGSDASPGPLAEPFATIQKAADTMSAGDTCYIRGGNYYEAVVINGLNGTSGSPVSFTSYNDEIVTFDGSQSLSDLGSTGWTLHSGNIYKTTLSTDIWQLYIDGELMIPARWPNANFDDGSIWDRLNKWGRGADTSTNGSLVDDPHANADLAASNLDMTGAMAILNVGSWKSWTRVVNSHSAGSGTFTYDTADLYKNGGYYFIEGKLNLLDVEKEWFYDTSTKILYLHAPGGVIPAGDIRGKTQTYAFDVTASTYITLNGLDFFGTTFKFYDSENVLVENCILKYPSCSKRMLGSIAAPEATKITQPNKAHVSNCTVKDCSFSFAESYAIYTDGDGNRVENCFFEYIDWVASELPYLQAGIYMRGPNGEFSRNTINTSGASELMEVGDTPLVEYCEFINYGLMQNDGAAIQYTIGTQPGSITRYNWFHDAIKYGARFDAPVGSPTGGDNGLLHHNVGWNNPAAMMVKGEFHQSYNNTAFNNSGNGIIILDGEAGSNNGSTTRNNAANKLSGHRSSFQAVPGTSDHNWNGYVTLQDIRTQLRDPDNWDFRPITGASVVDAGTNVAGVTDGYLGAAPDMGAYEDGAADYWIPGCRFVQASTPIPPNGNDSVKLDADLMWLSGKDATSHKIYFGSNPGSLTYQGEQTSNIFDPGTLTSNTVYYWQVDEVSPLGTVLGDVWSFDTTVPGSEIQMAAFSPVGDTYVQDSSPNSNYGGNTQIKLITQITYGYNRNGYMKFNVDVPGNIIRAELDLHNAGGTHNIGVGLHAMSDTSWDENTMTWNNRPVIDGALLDTKNVNAGSWTTFDVSAGVTSTGLVSFGMIRDPLDTQRSIDSKESSFVPVLRVSYVLPGSSNSAPVFSSNPVVKGNASEDAAYGNTLANDATDPDGDPLTFSALAGPAWLNIALDGTLSGTPANVDVGLNSWTVQVTDGTETDTATLEVTVDNVNDAPAFFADPINKSNALENAAYSDSISGSATDVDVGDTQTYSKVSGPAWLSVAVDGTLSGTPGAGDVGANVFVVKVEDIALASDTATLNITVDAAPVASIVYTESASAPAANVVASLTASDSILNNITVANNDGVGSENMYGQSFKSVVAFDLAAISFHATGDTKSYGASQKLELAILEDTTGDNVPDTLVGSVHSVDFLSITGSTPWKTLTLLTPVSCNDDTVYGFVFTLIGPVSNNLRVSTDRLTLGYTEGTIITSTYDAGAFPSLPIGLNGGRDLIFSVQATAPVNQAPVFTADPINKANGDENVAYSGSIAGDASDPESDPMTFSKVSGPAWLSVASDGTLSGTPAAGNVGLNVFVVQVDATGGSDTVTLNITVDAAPVNQAPAFTVDPVSKANGDENVAYVGSIATDASDPESDPLTFSKVSGPAWLSVASDGTLSGTPGAGDAGANAFVVQVDALGGSDTATLNITVDAAPTWSTLVSDDFESGWGNWSDGGSDARLSSQWAVDSQCFAIQDNSSSSEVELSSALDLTGYTQLEIDFSYVVTSFENTEDFWLRYSSDGGSSWVTIKAFVNDVDFVDDGTRYFPSITIDNGSYTFNNNVKIMFECDASGNGDDVYIDDVLIQGLQ